MVITRVILDKGSPVMILDSYSNNYTIRNTIRKELIPF
nr:MAG TPA: hypothetical protein [Caudoviricetes sp.]